MWCSGDVNTVQSNVAPCSEMQCNIVVHSDGGTRAGTCSATGWIVEVGVHDGCTWVFRPLVMAGTYISSPISSFHAEALALEECVLFVSRLLVARAV